ncbi:hypothetical protein GU700_01010 [Methylobacterium sp. NI91]|nr:MULTISPECIES: hypothetical protein [unclassified Methylobacterium]QIJ73305.1 hypothetical protein CLZ_01010 [Methylobacterium sp. CLZ]QIJ78209.1 hypothetical protein GU700_01010 [Methylobacterium sp. NI91]
MAYQPALNIGGISLAVELKAERATPEGEGLLRADVGRGEKLGTSGQVEGVPDLTGILDRGE